MNAPHRGYTSWETRELIQLIEELYKFSSFEEIKAIDYLSTVGREQQGIRILRGTNKADKSWRDKWRSDNFEFMPLSG